MDQFPLDDRLTDLRAAHTVSRWINKKYRRSPMVIPIVIEE